MLQNRHQLTVATYQLTYQLTVAPAQILRNMYALRHNLFRANPQPSKHFVVISVCIKQHIFEIYV